MIARLEAEAAASKEAHGAAEKRFGLELAQLREESEGLKAQAEQADVLMARCARLEVSWRRCRDPIETRRYLPISSRSSAKVAYSGYHVGPRSSILQAPISTI